MAISLTSTLVRMTARLSACALVLSSLSLATTAHAEVGVTNDTILIGQSAPMSGPAAALGQQLNLGAKLYFNAVNAAGGVNGRKIELKVLDDFYEPDAAARNTKTLIDNTKVFALFGYVGADQLGGAQAGDARRRAVLRALLRCDGAA